MNFLNRITIILSIALGAMTLSAQQSLVPPAAYLFTDDIAFKLGIEGKSMNIGEMKFSQVAFPVVLSVPLSQWINIRIANTPNSTSSDSISAMKSMSDTHLGVTFYNPDWNVILIGDVNLPSGIKAASRGKQALSSAIGFNAFGYQVQSLGQGLDFQAAIAYAMRPTPNAIMNAGIGYLTKGKYQAIDTLGKYDPGDEYSAIIGGEYRFSRRSSLSVDLAINAYGSDRLSSIDLDGREFGDPFIVREPGLRMTLSSRYGIVSPDNNRHTINFTGRFRLREDRITISGAKITTGPQYELLYNGKYPFSGSETWTWKVLCHIAYYIESDYNPQSGQVIQYHNAFLLSPGGGLSWNASDGINIEAQTRITIGSVNLYSKKESVFGYTIALISTFSF